MGWQLVKVSLRSRAGDSKSVQKFVFISATTLPIQPMPRVRAALLKSDQSDICWIRPSGQWHNGTVFGVEYSIVKHSQWVVLNRRDADTFARGWENFSYYHHVMD